MRFVFVVCALGCAGSFETQETEAAGPRREALGIVCEASLSVAGDFEAGAPQPADVFGCWPVGTWRFTAHVFGNDCPAPPALEDEYAFEVTRTPEERLRIAYTGHPGQSKTRLKVSSGGGGLCEGGFELFSEDFRTVTRLKPSLHADSTITGFGEVEVYTDPQL
jgi:hypothetical protein